MWVFLFVIVVAAVFIMSKMKGGKGCHTNYVNVNGLCVQNGAGCASCSRQSGGVIGEAQSIADCPAVCAKRRPEFALGCLQFDSNFKECKCFSFC